MSNTIATLTPTNIVKTSAKLRSDLTLWTFNYAWTTGADDGAGGTDILTIPVNCTLYMNFIPTNVNPQAIAWNKNGEQINAYDGNWIQQSLACLTNDTLRIAVLHFDGCEGDITVRLNNGSGRIIDEFHYTVLDHPGCYLTTACVNYKGLDDNCSELTAMRLLRAHYVNETGYVELINEYYELAPFIIEGINQESNPNEIYEQIYQSVKICETAVNNEDWATAHDEYLEMYYQLAETYISNYQRLMPL